MNYIAARQVKIYASFISLIINQYELRLTRHHIFVYSPGT